MTDEEAVQLVRNGSSEALIGLIEKYKALVKIKARVYFIAGGDREDIIQEGMIGLFKAVKDYDATRVSSFRSFAEMCVIRQIITAIKTASRQKHLPLNSYISFSRPLYEDEDDKTYVDSLIQDGSGNPEQLLIFREDAENLEKRIRSNLSRFETAVFNHFIDGMLYTEIARIMGKSAKSIDNALSRIRKKAESVYQTIDTKSGSVLK